MKLNFCHRDAFVNFASHKTLKGITGAKEKEKEKKGGKKLNK